MSQRGLAVAAVRRLQLLIHHLTMRDRLDVVMTMQFRLIHMTSTIGPN